MDKALDIEKEARRWIGVRWRHQGRSHQTGVDCIGLCLRVYAAVGVAFVDRNDYARRSDGRDLYAALMRDMRPVHLSAAQSGDLAFFSRGSGGVHVGLIVQGADQTHLVHAHATRRKVVLEPLTQFAVPSAVFRIKEKP